MVPEMTPEAVTNRMKALDGLWELAVALKSSEMLDTSDVDPVVVNPTTAKPKDAQD